MDYLAIITQVGFPIAMVLYFIVRGEKIIINNTDAITRMTEVVEHCKRKK